MNNFKLMVVFLIIVVLISCNPKKSNSEESMNKDYIEQNINIEDAVKMIKKNIENTNFVILDVRTPREYKNGYINSSINIDFNKENFSEEISKLDKNKIYLVYCRSGNRSRQASIVMRKYKFTSVYNLTGGIIYWMKLGHPLKYK